LRGSIFRPFSIDVYPNNQLLNAEDLVVLDEIPFSKDMRFFGAQELLEYERLWRKSEEDIDNYIKCMPRNFELFLLYKRCEKMNGSIAKMNRVFSVLQQKKTMEEYQETLRESQFMVLSKFFATTVRQMPFDEQRPLDSIKKCLCFLSEISFVSAATQLPFLVQVLNRVSLDMSVWVPRELRMCFVGLLQSRFPEGRVRENRMIRTPLHASALLLISDYRKMLFGDRLLRIIDFLKVVQGLECYFVGCGQRKEIELLTFLMVESQNELLLETLIFLYEVMFARDCAAVFEVKVKEHWAGLTQAFWSLIADDSALVAECLSIRFP
jgi:hypothetical protein